MKYLIPIWKCYNGDCCCEESKRHFWFDPQWKRPKTRRECFTEWLRRGYETVVDKSGYKVAGGKSLLPSIGSGDTSREARSFKP